MTDWLTYDLKVALLIVVFYGFYRLLVARDTFHRLNRVVLLGSLVLSLLLPLCHVTVTLPAASRLSPLPHPRREGSNYSQNVGNQEERLSTPLPKREGQGGESAAFLLMAVYGVGVLLCLARTFTSIRRVRQIIAQGERRDVPSYISWQTPRMRLSVVDDERIKPFSWMHTVVLSRKDYTQDLLDGTRGHSVILAHECGHVACRHSFDMLFVDMIAALQWFNPVVWLLREELRMVHEYEADDRVLSQGFNAYQYLNLLILKAAGDAGYSIANGISKESALSKRVKMMIKHKSSWRSWMKLLYIVPVVAVSLAATAKVVVEYKEPRPAFALTSHVPNGAAKSGIVIMVPEKVKGVSSTNRNVSLYDDGKLIVVDGRVITKDELLQLKQEDVEYIDVLGEESATKLFGSQGSKGGIVIKTKNAQTAEPFALHAVVDQNGRITGFTHEGEPDARQPMTFAVGNIFIDGHEATAEEAANYQSLSIESYEIVHHPNTAGDAKFGYKDKEGVLSLHTAKPADDPIFEVVENMPTFPGGEAKCFEFLMHNLKYPKKAIELGLQGRVLVQFVVEKDGSLTNLKIVKSVSSNNTSDVSVVAYGAHGNDDGSELSKAEQAESASKLLDEEALRVVRLMPKWNPGRQRGKVVRSKFVIPVTFRLN